MHIDLEMERVVDHILQKDIRAICLQLPDGLKPRAGEIQDYIEEEADVEVFIWGGSCFGSCDIPLGLENLDVDLLVQWGHNG